MTRQPRAFLFSFFHILHFWEEHGTVKVVPKYYLELDLAKVVLLLTKSLLFQFYFQVFYIKFL